MEKQSYFEVSQLSFESLESRVGCKVIVGDPVEDGYTVEGEVQSETERFYKVYFPEDRIAISYSKKNHGSWGGGALTPRQWFAPERMAKEFVGAPATKREYQNGRLAEVSKWIFMEVTKDGYYRFEAPGNFKSFLNVSRGMIKGGEWKTAPDMIIRTNIKF